MTRRYASIVLDGSATIEGLAARYLGDAGRWREIAQLNALRYPYLTADPREKFGPLLARAWVRGVPHPANPGDGGLQPALTANLSAGSSVVPLLADLVVQEGQVALLTRMTSEGGVSWEGQRVLGVIHAGSIDAAVAAAYEPEYLPLLGTPPLLVLAQPVAGTWVAGTTIEIYADPRSRPTQVLMPGETILIPLTQAGADLVSLDAGLWGELLGTDLALDDRGALAYDRGGDLALAAGQDNLRQALRNRLLTQVGGLPLHRSYGDPLLDRLGHVYEETLLLASADARGAVTADPRVAGVTHSRVARSGDLIAVDLTVQVAGTQQLVSISTILTPPQATL